MRQLTSLLYNISGRCSRPSTPFLSCPVSCFDGKEDTPHDLQGESDRHMVQFLQTKQCWLWFYKAVNLEQTDYLFSVIIIMSWIYHHSIKFSFMCNSCIVSLLIYSLEGHDEWWLHCADASWVSLLLKGSNKWKIYTWLHHKTSWDSWDGLSIETLSATMINLCRNYTCTHNSYSLMKWFLMIVGRKFFWIESKPINAWSN